MAKHLRENVVQTGAGVGIPTRLFAAAREAAKHAYAPYSQFSVGAAVETIDGQIFSGANMENASYGLTVCAEIGALQAASSAGVLGQVCRIAIVGGPIDPQEGYTPRATAPCGRCRQLIMEAARIGGRDIEVWYADLDREDVRARLISELLPEAFGPENLGGDEHSGIKALS
jgi:cytidine deaminase